MGFWLDQLKSNYDSPITEAICYILKLSYMDAHMKS